MLAFALQTNALAAKLLHKSVFDWQSLIINKIICTVGMLVTLPSWLTLAQVHRRKTATGETECSEARCVFSAWQL